MKIDVIIPTYRPGDELFELLDVLACQSVQVNKVILMNTVEAYFRKLIAKKEFLERYPFAEVHHLPKKKFDHGGTRRIGVKYSDADVFVMMTQDAMPADKYMIEQLTSRLSGGVAVAYGRQLPRRDSGTLERISRQFNYPDASRLKGKADLEKLGIKTFFCSNVCAAYRRDVYELLGGFPKQAIFNEDMIYASKAVQSGWLISYEAGAKVIHSHNYSCMQQFHRNFDLGASQADHPEVFGAVKSESEGKKYVKYVGKALKERGELEKLPYFLLQSVFKYAGYLLGKNYRKLPKCLIYAASDNKQYWKRLWKIKQNHHKKDTK